ncbi:MAG: GNAT family N-acetyltransferase [Pseudomonadota bacterium]
MKTATVKRLGVDDVAQLRAINALFADAFEDRDAYLSAPPSAEYLQRLLSAPNFVALGCLKGNRLVGGLTAYALSKAEQENVELYIYDLAVDADARRQGVASDLLSALKPIARATGASSIYVQADHGDDAAIALYRKFGTESDVLHFDIDIPE